MFLRKFIFGLKWAKWSKKGNNQGFFKKFFLLEILLLLFLDLVLSESSYYQLFPCTNPISGKILVLELRDKMLSASEIAGLLNQLYLKKQLVNQLDFWLNEYRFKKHKRCFVNFQLDIVKSILSQSDFRILKSAIS